MEQVEIFCENTGKSYPIEIGSTLREVKKSSFHKTITTSWEPWSIMNCKTYNISS